MFAIDKMLKWSAVFAFGVMLCMAFVFFQERICFADAAGTAINLIGTKCFSIQLDRYGAFITQVLPLIAIYCHASLKTICQLYSVNFVLFHAAVFAIIYYWKQYQLALIWLCYLVLMMSDSFFYVHNEIYTAHAYVLLGFAFYQKDSDYQTGFSYKGYIPLGLFCLGLFCHLSVICTIVFGLVFLFVLEGKKNKGYGFIVWLLLLCICICMKFIFLQSNWYDSEKLESFGRWHLLTELFTLKSTVMFLHALYTTHLFFSVFTIFVLAFLIRFKQWIHVALMLGACVLYFVLTSILFSNAALMFYMQSEWLTYSIFIAFPFAYIVLARLDKLAYLIPVIVLQCVVHIYLVYPNYSRALRWKKKQLTYMKENQLAKMLILPSTIEKDKVISTWAMGYESILLSSLKGKEHTRTFYSSPYIVEADTNSQSFNRIAIGGNTFADTILDKSYFDLPKAVYVIKKDE